MKNETEVVAFGKRLRALRKEAKLSQEKFAWEADVGVATIQRMENGEQAATMDMFFTLVKALKVHPNKFFEEIEFDFQDQ